MSSLLPELAISSSTLHMEVGGNFLTYLHKLYCILAYKRIKPTLLPEMLYKATDDLDLGLSSLIIIPSHCLSPPCVHGFTSYFCYVVNLFGTLFSSCLWHLLTQHTQPLLDHVLDLTFLKMPLPKFKLGVLLSGSPMVSSLYFLHHSTHSTTL